LQNKNLVYIVNVITLFRKSLQASEIVMTHFEWKDFTLQIMSISNYLAFMLLEVFLSFTMTLLIEIDKDNHILQMKTCWKFYFVYFWLPIFTCLKGFLLQSPHFQREPSQL